MSGYHIKYIDRNRNIGYKRVIALSDIQRELNALVWAKCTILHVSNIYDGRIVWKAGQVQCFG